MIPVVALVGRPNVGKSTLFNALTRTREALVVDRPGVTRDRHYGLCRSDNRVFVVVDTGGIYGEGDELCAFTKVQADAAIEEAALVVLVVDARDGLLPGDQRILDALRRCAKPFVLAVNKCDGLEETTALAEFTPLGIERVLPLAASHRQGVSELTELLHQNLPIAEESNVVPRDSEQIRVCVVGRPNVGKSTLVNRLLGEDRMIVSELAGTTRDSITIPLERDGRKYLLIDTAGVRRRAKVEDILEKFSVIKTLQALHEAQVAVVMIDASVGVTEQDVTVLAHALGAGRALVVAVNKWDGLDNYQRERCRVELERKLDFVGYALRVFISAKHGSGLAELLDAIHRAWESTQFEAGAAQLTKALEIAVESHQPPLVRGKLPKFRYAHMGGREPTRIVIHGSRLAYVADAYKRYLENFFRKRFKLEACPIRFEFRDGNNPFEGKRNELSERQVRKKRRIIRNAKR